MEEEFKSYPDYIKEWPDKFIDAQAIENDAAELKYITKSQDKITLENSRLVFEAIHKNGLEPLGELCGGLNPEAFRRIYLGSDCRDYVKPHIDGQNIRSKDLDFRSGARFLRALALFLPQFEIKKGEEDEEKRVRFIMREPRVWGDEPVKIVLPEIDKLMVQTDVSIPVESFPTIPYVDEQGGVPYEVLQGVCTTEQPYGKEGPQVRLIDPMSIILAKMGAIQGGVPYQKKHKYRWHMRICALCVPYYLEEKTAQFKEGKIDRDPAVTARRLLVDLDRSDYEYYLIFDNNRKALDALKKALAPYARGVQKEIYGADDIRPIR